MEAGGDLQQQEEARPGSLASFKAWMRWAGVLWDERVIRFDEGVPGCSGAAWGVFAVADVPEGHCLATLPKAAVLSAKTCGVADLLRQERLGGGLALTIGVLYEAARGPKSKWYGYLATLPQAGEPLPVFWAEEQLRQLAGTDAERRARDDRELLAADFESEVAPLLAKYPRRLGPVSDGWTLKAWMVASSWVASRAFFVDEHHGDALVPLADVFNHKAARVELSAGAVAGRLQGFVVAEQAAAAMQHSGGSGGEDEDDPGSEDGSDDDEEGGEGAGGSSSHSDEGGGDDDDDPGSEDGSDGEEEQEGEDEDDGRVPIAALDVPPDEKAPGPARADFASLDPEPFWGIRPSMPDPEPETAVAEQPAASSGGQQQEQQGGRRLGRWQVLAAAAEARGGPARNLRLDIGICSLERAGVDLLDIVAAQRLHEGSEVFNTYGEHGNADLVNKYGFCLRFNAFDEVTLSKDSLLQAAEGELGAKAAKRRTKFLEQHSDLLHPDEEPFLLLPPRHVSLPLYMALAACAASDKQLAQMEGMDDLLQQLLQALQSKEQQGPATAAVQPGEAAVAGHKRPREEHEHEHGSGDEAPACKRGGCGHSHHQHRAAADSAAPAAETPVTGAASKRGSRRAKAGAGAACCDDPDHHHHHHSHGEPDPHGKAAPSEGHGGGDEDDGDDDQGVAELPEDVEIELLDPSQPDGGASNGRAAAEQDSSGKQGQKRKAHGGGGSSSGGAEDAAGAGGGLWSPTMRRLLRRMVAARQAAYPTSLKQDVEHLESLDSGGGAKDGDAGLALRSSLVLRIGEKELLAAVSAALGPGAQ